VRALLDPAIRSSVILLAGLAVSARLRHRSAALRHSVLATAIFAAALVVPLGRVLPAWDLRLPASTPAPGVARSHAADDLPPASTLAATGGQPAAPLAGAVPLIGIVWAAGFAVSAAMLLAGFARVVRIASRADRVEDGPWARMAAEVSAAYGLRRRVAVLHTDAPDLLATWGLFRPRVLLPSHAREWSDDRVRVVLCHELAHVRRHDWLVQTGAEALRTVYWFNPLVWTACTRLRRESEQACDDAVLDAGVAAREYAGHLLELARRCRRSGPAWASAIPMARPSTLERRIAAMLNPDLDRRALSRRAVAVAAALLLGVTLPTAAFRAEQSAPRTLAGSVYDATGAVLPVVELTLEDAQQAKSQAVTDATGQFEFPAVQPGHYVLEASLAGFRALRQEIDLRNARDWDRAITLQVGEVRETITVRERRVAAARTSSPAQGPQPVRVGGNIRAPRKQLDVRPVYPATMREAGREGVVPIEAVIGRDGSVLSLRVLSAQVHPDFAIAAVDAVRQWRFDPTLLNGEPVEVVMTVSVQFSLE
jgi:TonB family protein